MGTSAGAVSCAELRKRRKAEYYREYGKRVKTNTDKSGAREEQLVRRAAYNRLYRARKKEERIYKLRQIEIEDEHIGTPINGLDVDTSIYSYNKYD
jgi:hypothetical protein